MLRTTAKTRFLRKFRKLSSVGRGEVFSYTRWLLTVEKQERLARLRDRASKDPMSGPYERRKNKSPLLIIQKWLSR